MFVDLIVIVPLEEEFKQFARVFELGQNLTQDTLATYKFECDGINGIVILQDEMGYWGATRAATSIIGAYKCSVMVCAGIAGKVSNDLKIGDVCYSGTVIDTITNSKIEDDGKGAQKVAVAPDFFPTPKLLHGNLTFFRVMPEFSSEYERWQQEARANDQQEAEDASLKQYTPVLPDSFQGNIACGLVSQSRGYKDVLKGVDRKVLAIETESGAVARFCYDNSLDFVAIRGISDNADEQKNEHEALTKDVSRRVAGYNAFSFLKFQISSNTFFRRYLLERRPSGATQPPLPIGDEPTNPLADAQELLLNRTVARLRETNQSFKALPDGAVLPLPRVRVRPGKVTPTTKRGEALEFRESVARFQRLFAVIPRIFPDKSLAWLIAHALHYEQWEERQFVPVVISGDEVKPPRGTPERLAALDLTKIRENGGTPVFIIDSFPLGSSTSAAFLAEIMRSSEDDRFIVLVQDDPNVRDIEEFVAKSSSEHVDIVDTSFAEITNFLANHFSMKSEAAQVVAIRLRNVFRRFGLQMHPTFFAGIPQELIASILEANRRGELIQLAVDGYLTHVVSIDAEKGRLSRTTRAEFLRRVIRETKLEKLPLAMDRLLAMADDFFKERGYPNDPKNFIDKFFEANVLIETAGKVEFGLTFVGAYFTALELCEDANLAIAYFDLSSDEIDFLAFDLYAELCAHEDFVDALIARVGCAQVLSDEREPVSKLETGAIHPVMMKQKGLASAVSRRVEIATQAVADGRDETAEKQRLLDVAERVLDETVEREGSDIDEPDPSVVKINEALRFWGTAVVLLGQGAEKLDDTRKKILAGMVTKLGAAIIDDWTNFNASIDYEELKKKLTNEESLKHIIDATLEIPAGVTEKELIEAFVDIAEMALTSEPLRIVLSHLADEAGHRVVLPAVKSVVPESFLERLLLASWLAEVDAGEAKPLLKDMAKNFPQAPFLRTTLATYYMFRVYWSMSDKNSRLQLLHYANTLTKPMGRELPVREITKQIKSSNPDDVVSP